jgi:hypothetical protein
VGRLCCILLLVFPYHWINVLAYNPDIAGTFFFLLAIWAFLLLNEPTRYANGKLILLALTMSVAMLLAGIQRGSLDVMLFVVILAAMCLRQMNRRNIAACLLALLIVWMPLRHEFTKWVNSQDASHLSSHMFGFMIRGWNLETNGYYLPLFEQLDMTSPAAERQKTMETVLVTEFSSAPVRAFATLPPRKDAAFFAVGFGGESDLELSGYTTAASVYRILGGIFAFFLIAFSLLGVTRCWNTSLGQRIFVPVALMVFSALAIIFIGETSPRYSHCIHFVILLLAAIGIEQLNLHRVHNRSFLRRQLLQLGRQSALILLCWLVAGTLIAAGCRAATNYHFADMRFARIESGPGLHAQLAPLHNYSRSWESVLDLQRGTSLPATLQVDLPVPKNRNWDHVTIAVWIIDQNPNPGYEVRCASPGAPVVAVPAGISGHIARIQLNRASGENPVLAVSLIPSTPGVTTAQSDIRLGIGYALVN